MDHITALEIISSSRNTIVLMTDITWGLDKSYHRMENDFFD